jgi:hypothetical protein
MSAGVFGVSGTDSSGVIEAPSAAGGTSPLVPNLPPNATDAQAEAAAMSEWASDPALQQYITQTYGYIGAYLLTNPELLPILVAAGLENWDQARLDGAVAGTSWWKNTSQAFRNFQELQSTDPGEANAQIAMMQDTILTQAQSIGVNVPQSQMGQLARFAVAFGWSTDVIDQTLRSGYNASFGANGLPSFGEAATFADQAQQLAGEYLQPLSKAQLGFLTSENIQGKLTADGLQQQFQERAQWEMPWMAKSVAMGVTPSQFLSGYASAAAKTLDIDPSNVNWSDPKWFKALLVNNGKPNQNTDAPQLNQTPVSISQFQQNLMKDPAYGYTYTQGARDTAMTNIQQLLQTFGAVKS